MGWFAEFFPDNPRNPVALAQNTFRQEADSSSETWVAASCMAHGSKESFSRIRIPFIRVLFYGAMTIPQFWPTRSPQASIFDGDFPSLIQFQLQSLFLVASHCQTQLATSLRRMPHPRAAAPWWFLTPSRAKIS